MVKERRKSINFTIKRRMQLRLLVRVMAVVLVSLGLVTVFFYLYADQEVGGSFKQFHINARIFLDFLLPAVIVAFFMGLIAAIGLAVFIPHKIAGPLYRIEKDLEDKVGSGDLTVNFTMRKGDEVGDLVGSINVMIERLRIKMGEVQGLTEELKSLSQKEASLDEFAELAGKLEGAVKEFKL